MPWFQEGYGGKFDIYRTDYSIHSKLRIFPWFWSHTWMYNIQANERLPKVKEKRSTIQFKVFNLSFSFFNPMFQTISAINRSGACYFSHPPNKWWMCWCVCAIAHIKWRRLLFQCGSPKVLIKGQHLLAAQCLLEEIQQ